jgi:GNAT superfamily N-acetyltransferase
MSRLEIHPFGDDFLGEAARLLTQRHAAHRLVEPALPAEYERPTAAREAIEQLLAAGGSGAAATRGGKPVGFVLGAPRTSPFWGPNVWVEPAGHASVEPEAVRDLYALAATRWVEEGRTAHYAVVPASDADAVDAWFRLGFGHQHVHAIRDVPATVEPLAAEGVVVRPATREDVDALASFDALLPLHQGLAPCFSQGEGVPSLEQAREEWMETFADGDDGAFLAELGGTVVGSAFGCPVERSGAHSGLARPAGAAMLAYAAVAPEARDRGVGQALARAVLGWARARGCDVIVTDWRMTNLLSSRAWPRAGYRPTFFRLFRAIA